MVQTLRRILVGLLVLLAVAALVGGYVLVTTGDRTGQPVSTSVRVVDRTDDDWQVVAYDDVQVQLPPSWTIQSRSARGDEGSSAEFFQSATFDPATGPGVQRQQPSTQQPDGGWGGYVLMGRAAVFVLDPDRSVVRRILRSARER